MASPFVWEQLLKNNWVELEVVDNHLGIWVCREASNTFPGGAPEKPAFLPRSPPWLQAQHSEGLFSVAGDFFLILHLPVQDRHIISFTPALHPSGCGGGFFFVILEWL